MNSNRTVPFHTGITTIDTIKLLPGHVLWLPMPQTMSGNLGIEEKTRPFVVMEAATVERLNNGMCKPITLTGVCGTSQAFLVQGRPHISFALGRQGKTTYAGPDLVRSIYCQGIEIPEPTTRLPDTELAQLRDGLGKVLRPESWFRWPDGKFLPGHLYQISTPGFHGTVMILLRRGRFVVSSDEREQSWHNNSGQSSYAPFLALAFRTQGKVTTTRNVGWNQVEVMPIHHAALEDGRRCTEPSEFSSLTALNVLNLLRSKVGVPTLDRDTKMRSAQNIFSWLFYTRRLTF